MQSKQAGFTLIELIIVIVVLGILAATAVPKFIDITDDAHEAGHSGNAGGFASGVALAHAKWLVSGNGGAGSLDLDGDGTNDLVVNASGWPLEDFATTDGAYTDDDCVNIWNAMLEGNVASVVVSGASTGVEDYEATWDAAQNTCTYDYMQGGTMDLVYDTDNGAISVDKTF